MIKITTDEILTLDKIVALVILEEMLDGVTDVEFIDNMDYEKLMVKPKELILIDHIHSDYKIESGLCKRPNRSLSQLALDRFGDSPKTRAFTNIVAMVNDDKGQSVVSDIKFHDTQTIHPYTLQAVYSEASDKIGGVKELYSYMKSIVMILFAYQYDFNVRLKSKVEKLVNDICVGVTV